jgi:hypothetical protein
MTTAPILAPPSTVAIASGTIGSSRATTSPSPTPAARRAPAAAATSTWSSA